MEHYTPVAAVTLLAVLLLFAMTAAVGGTRRKTGIFAPAMTGDPLLERTIRAHYNTLEWMLVFLPALWLFAAYVSVGWAAALGGLWIVGRIAYFIGYRAETNKRYPGFFIQMAATVVLLFGALIAVLYRWIGG